MRSFKTLLGCCLLVSSVLQAMPVEPTITANIAKHFFATTDKGASLGNALQLSLAWESKMRFAADQPDPITLFSIYNINQTEGFVIVSNDNATIPVLGYSTTGGFDPQNVPTNMQKWMEHYQQEMVYLISRQIPADKDIRDQWALWQDEGAASQVKTLSAVSPLLSTTWDQAPYYNAYCPGGSVTGCVATAMAQVMKFWNHPQQGTGFHSYNEDNYGTLSANFGGTTYNWQAMSNHLTTYNDAVATLMYHCGVAVDMNYSPQSSGAWVSEQYCPSGAATAESALETYFGYATSLSGALRDNYTSSSWISLMKTELNAGRPILHAGFGTGGGHAFVCDGYDNSDYFHYNWGWGGQADGYFWNNALNPGSLGTGGGSGGFNTNQHIIIGVQPAGGGAIPSSFQLYAPVVVTPNPVYYQQSLTVTADIINTGNTTFYGDIAAALFDQNYNFVQYIQTISETNGLPAGYHYTNGKTFTINPLSASPGSYYVAIYVRPSGGNWIQVSNGSYQNMVPLTITQDNDLKMYSAMTVSPNPIVQNGAVSINVDVANYGANFSGSLSVDVHNTDGSWIQSIEEKNGMSLGNNMHYTGGLNFYNSNLSLDPGTYKLALWEWTSADGWKLNVVNLRKKSRTLHKR